jgi:hypothetical protein
MSMLQYGHSNKPVQYAAKYVKTDAQNTSFSASSSSGMSIGDFPAWASSTTGLPVPALMVLTMVSNSPLPSEYSVYKPPDHTIPLHESHLQHLVPSPV